MSVVCNCVEKVRLCPDYASSQDDKIRFERACSTCSAIFRSGWINFAHNKRAEFEECIIRYWYSEISRLTDCDGLPDGRHKRIRSTPEKKIFYGWIDDAKVATAIYPCHNPHVIIVTFPKVLVIAERSLSDTNERSLHSNPSLLCKAYARHSYHGSFTQMKRLT